MITKILIAEDNTSAFSCYQNFLSKDKTIEIIGHAQDGESAIKMYTEKKPDILILDLNLPKKNGLEVLTELVKYEKERPKCNVIVVSGEEKLLHELLNTRKVFIKIPKPTPYSQLMDSIKDFQKEQMVNSFSESKCQDLLIKLNINPISKNGRLLTEAIEMCYFNYEMLDNMKILYGALAFRKNCSPQKIKSCLRTAVDTANKRTNYNTLYSIFYSEVEDLDNLDNSISPKHFLSGIIYSLKKQ